jgi:flavin reductase (DIM6/NTAB) family NADH-FMN oxidoreductase RutF
MMFNSLEAEQFKNIFRSHPAGVAIITLHDNGKPMGFTATSVISVSVSPPVIVFSVQGNSSSLQALEQSESVIIHFLDEHHEGLAARFSTPGIDRFCDTEWQTLPTGEPHLVEVNTWVRCTLIHRMQVGSSLIIQARPESAAVSADRTPMIYHDRTFCGVSKLAVQN